MGLFDRFSRRSDAEIPEVIVENAPMVMATGLLFGPDRKPVRFITRLAPKNEYDSGWIFFSGQEPPGYVDDAGNFDLAPLRSFLELDPWLASLVDAPVGSTFEKVPGAAQWAAVTDWEPQP